MNKTELIHQRAAAFENMKELNNKPQMNAEDEAEYRRWEDEYERRGEWQKM